MCRCILYNYLESCATILGNINKASFGGVTDEWMPNFEEEKKLNVSKTSQSDPKISPSNLSELTGVFGDIP